MSPPKGKIIETFEDIETSDDNQETEDRFRVQMKRSMGRKVTT